MKKTSLILLLPFALLGCGDQKTRPFLGQWNGEFTVSKVGRGGDTEKDRKQNALRGYVSIRLNKNIYLLHLEGEQQQIDIKGKWTYTGTQITLDPKEDTKIVTEGGTNGPNPNLKYVPDPDLYEAFTKKIILNISPDGSNLTSPTTSIAFLEGTFKFTKE